jgi:hypothetical protein
VINGRTGEVQGERPYSWWKISFAVIAAILLAGGIYYYMDQAGLLQNTQKSYQTYPDSVPGVFIQQY